MLKLNTKPKLPLIASCLAVGGLFLYQYLTFIPSYSSATTTIETTTPVTLPTIEGTITTKFGTEELGYKTYMQEIDLAYCEKLPNLTTGQLADGRDGKIYWVTKLAGTCWMTQDLDLDLQGMTITNTNDGAKIYRGSDVANAWTDGDIASKIVWTTNNNEVQWYERDKTHSTEHTSLGNLYSFEAATAGTGSKVITDNASATGSICPAGWKLPIGGNSSITGSFMSLQNAGMNGDNAASNPYFFQYGGWNDGSPSNSDYGYYWSATSESNTDAYLLAFGVYRDFYPSFTRARRYGLSVRCVVRDSNYIAPVIPSGSTINNPTLSVTIPKVLTLDVTDNVNIETNPNNISTGTFTTTVTSNSSYNIALSTVENGHTDLINDKTPTASIPALSSTITTSNNKWWGIKCTNTTNTNCTKPNYTGLTTTPEIYYSSSTSTSSTPTIFNIGIQTSPDLPSGTYSTSILVTASQN